MLMLDNMKHYEKFSKYLLFDDGLSDVVFEVVDAFSTPDCEWLSMNLYRNEFISV